MGCGERSVVLPFLCEGEWKIKDVSGIISSILLLPWTCLHCPGGQPLSGFGCPGTSSGTMHLFWPSGLMMIYLILAVIYPHPGQAGLAVSALPTAPAQGAARQGIQACPPRCRVRFVGTGGSWHLADNVAGAWAQACSKILLTNPLWKLCGLQQRAFLPTVSSKKRKASQKRIRTTFIQDKKPLQAKWGSKGQGQCVCDRDLGYVGPGQRDRQRGWPGKGWTRVQSRGLRAAFAPSLPRSSAGTVAHLHPQHSHFWHRHRRGWLRSR